MVDLEVFTAAESEVYLRAVLADHPHLLDDTDMLASDLGFLPLALAQATAYMLDRGLSCAAYRRRWGDRRRRLTSLLPTSDELPDGHQATVATTWSLSIERANQLEPQGIASPPLEIAGLPDPNGIPTELFETPAVLTWIGTRLGRTFTKDDVSDGLSNLHRMSLITVDPTQRVRTVRVHALVQRASRDSILPERPRDVRDALQKIRECLRRANVSATPVNAAPTGRS